MFPFTKFVVFYQKCSGQQPHTDLIMNIYYPILLVCDIIYQFMTL